ncbi:hypothetical protein [Ruficoccus sp. ZRK36]|uniref:hypothetical protein n=1 Tax=Ruficoccus sp. ZRK36 TaxID=2866311 RepID=UPI001C72F753|nr:hypothetical protein [Ruficoccus sp. ZRK36]QYY36107.1 hypothetical protein K0V07_01240 [Ruficoccus sp. ZRK36]
MKAKQLQRKHFISAAALTVALLGGIAPAAQADLVAIDDFDSYTSGTAIGGQNGGTGWAYSWTNGSGLATVEVSSKSLTYDLEGHTLGGGNSLMFTGGNTQNATQRAAFTSADTSGQDYYVSFLFQVVGAEGETSGQAGGNNTITMAAKGENYDAINDNLLFVNGANSKTQARNNGDDSSVETVLNYGQTYLAVVKYTGWNSTAGVYETTTVWLNPTTSDENTTSSSITATVTTPGEGSKGFQGIGVRTYFNDAGADVYIDDLRVGTSWDSVVAIPESRSTSVLLGLAALSLLVFGLRRRR